MSRSLNVVQRISLVVGFAGLMASYQNCSGSSFTQQSVSAVSAESCTSSNPTTTQENLDIIFMVDNSDSTNSTDPDKTKRLQLINSYLQQYGNKTNFKVAMGWFAADAVVWDTEKQAAVSNPLRPFGTSSDLVNAEAVFTNSCTIHGTAYQNAFAAITGIVNSTTQPNNDGSNYIVVFVTDGRPTDLGQGNAQTTGVQNLVTNLLADVKNQGHLVSVSSVYLGPEDDTLAITNLKTMAQIGGGQFVDSNVTTTLNISDIITVPGGTCN